jgi:hypothetical protein
MKNRFAVFAFFTLLCKLLIAGYDGSQIYTVHLSDLSVAPDGSGYLYNDETRPGLYLGNTETGESKLIASGIGCALMAGWSPDGRYISFKLLEAAGGAYLQTPCLYELNSGAIIRLTEPVWQAGIPVFSRSGMLSYTIGKRLVIRDATLSAKAEFELPAYCNYAPLSPDGQSVVYNDQDDQLFIMDIATGIITPISAKGLYRPIWAPSGEVLLASTLSGSIITVNPSSLEIFEIGPGENPSWSADGTLIYFTRTIFQESRDVENMDLYCADVKTRSIRKLTESLQWESFPVTGYTGNKLYYLDQKEHEFVGCTISMNEAVVLKRFTAQAIKSQLTPRPETTEQLMTAPEFTQSASYFDIPYIHQVYDTPDWFNGSSACGATSAAMCLAYYDLLARWPVSVSSPSPHISDYGNYICSIYTFNNYTFNIWAYDHNNTKGYGGFGHIVRNNPAWSDTRGYMADYARKHGLSSEVDWNPSRAKLLSETGLQRPFVLLNDLTTSGHYISVIGAANEDATTIIVNDPYGDKNRGYKNYYGRRAQYDWPNYSNGHSNLNNVWCFIYFRGTPPVHPDLSVTEIEYPDTIRVNQQMRFTPAIHNYGNGNSAPCSAVLFTSFDTYFDATDSIIHTYEIPGISADDSSSEQQTITVSDSLSSNDYYIGFLADKDAVNRDMVPENNIRYQRIAVIGYPRMYNAFPYQSAVVKNNLTAVYVSYHDKFSGIDTARIRFSIDGVDLTGLCAKTKTKITYTPQLPFSDGMHTVRVQAINGEDYISNKQWSFSIETQTALENETVRQPNTTALQQNYPNPFNLSTRIQFTLAEADHVLIEVFDVHGNRVAMLMNERLNSGRHAFYWPGIAASGSALPSGVYFLRLKTSRIRDAKRLILLK